MIVNRVISIRSQTGSRTTRSLFSAKINWMELKTIPRRQSQRFQLTTSKRNWTVWRMKGRERERERASSWWERVSYDKKRSSSGEIAIRRYGTTIARVIFSLFSFFLFPFFCNLLKRDVKTNITKNQFDQFSLYIFTTVSRLSENIFVKKNVSSLIVKIARKTPLIFMTVLKIGFYGIFRFTYYSFTCNSVKLSWCWYRSSLFRIILTARKREIIYYIHIAHLTNTIDTCLSFASGDWYVSSKEEWRTRVTRCTRRGHRY